ncbi:MAG TPA: NAD(P)-dependent oxidoreductase [Steroidobacteraceae bacterium]
MNSRRRVLVTGAGGFIGRWSIEPLLELNYEVHAVLAAPRSMEHLRGATVHVADLLSEPDIDALLSRAAPTHLLHFAWIATPGVYWQSAENYLWAAAGEYLLHRFHAHGGTRAVMAGSCVEYDWSKVSVCEERKSPLADGGVAPLSPYAAGKLALQRAAAAFSSREQLSAAWGRIFFQYGPYEHPERLVASVIRHLLTDQPALCSHGRQVRSFLHVADVGAAFVRLLDSEVQGPVNIGSDERTSLAAMIQGIARLIGRPELVRLDARSAPAGEPPILIPDVHRLRDELHWQPRFTLDEGLADAIAWWRNRLDLSPP